MNPENESQMGFLDHLEELRWRLIKSLSAIIIGSVLSFGYIEEILYFCYFPLARPLYR